MNTIEERAFKPECLKTFEEKMDLEELKNLDPGEFLSMWMADRSERPWAYDLNRARNRLVKRIVMLRDERRIGKKGDRTDDPDEEQELQETREQGLDVATKLALTLGNGDLENALFHAMQLRHWFENNVYTHEIVETYGEIEACIHQAFIPLLNGLDLDEQDSKTNPHSPFSIAKAVAEILTVVTTDWPWPR